MKTAHRWSNVRPALPTSTQYQRSGSWRTTTPCADLRLWAAAKPSAIAVTAHRADTGHHTLTYAQYAHRVEQFAAVLRELGVEEGDVVAVRLPNWWQVNALMLACGRLGAVFAPIQPTVRRRELEFMLRGTAASVCVTTDSWAGTDHAAELASMAGTLPQLRHRLVLGDAGRSGAVDLTARAQDVDLATVAGATAAEDPDRVSIVMFTSGTTGSPKAVLHSFNTLYAGHVPPALGKGLNADDVLYTPHPLTHALGQMVSNVIPLSLGAEAVFADVWDTATAVELMKRRGVSYVAAAPVFLEGLANEVSPTGIGLPSLRRVVGGATSIPASLVHKVSDGLGCTLEAVWGMTEVPGGTSTDRDIDRADWAAHSAGRVHPGIEVSLQADGEMNEHLPGRLLVRGPAVCLAVAGREDDEDAVLVADMEDGWYDTGDLALPDGRGGIRLVGRVADQVGGTFMVPVTEVENALRTHPAVTDVAVVGYGPENASVCAVISAVPPLTLTVVRDYLNALGMTEWYQPTRVEVLAELPRNATGKVSLAALRSWLGD
ncbi:AMP-binding protein [Streptomyces sp. NPDC055056]